MKNHFFKKVGVCLMAGILLANTLPTAFADTAANEMEIDSQKVVVTGEWNEDNACIFTVSLKVNGKAATAADFAKVKLAPSLIGGFEKVGTYGDFASNTSLIYAGTQKGWGVAHFYVTTKKSSIVKYTLTDGDKQSTEAVVVTPGDVNRDGMVTVRDQQLIMKMILSQETDYSNLPYEEELADINGEDGVTTRDNMLLNQMIAGIIQSN